MTDYVRVPREPTEAMIAAGERAAWDGDNSMPAFSAMRKAWSAMLAASPQGEGSSGDATNMVAPVDAVAWRWRIDDAQCPAWEYADTRPGLLSAPHLTIQPLYAHPPQPDAQGWRDIATAPELERVMVCGWNPPHKRVAGYWWWDEDTVFEGRATEHPTALYWCPVALPPTFPPPPSTHPAPIMPSGDTGELRERVARVIGDRKGHPKPWPEDYELADAILDLIQSERAG